MTECKHEWIQVEGKFTITNKDLNKNPVVIFFCKYCLQMIGRNIEKYFEENK